MRRGARRPSESGLDRGFAGPPHADQVSVTLESLGAAIPAQHEKRAVYRCV